MTTSKKSWIPPSAPTIIAMLKRGQDGIKEFHELRQANPDWRPDISNADLSDTDLRKVDFSLTNLTRVNFGGADLRGTMLLGAKTDGINWKHAQVDGIKGMRDIDKRTFLSVNNLL